MSKNCPEHIIKAAEAHIKNASIKTEQARSRIPKEYHDFLVMLEQSVKLDNVVHPIDDRARALGIWTWQGKGTYVTISLPYMSVNGRVQWARDEHRKMEKKLHFHAPIISDSGHFLTVRVESEIYGTATGSAIIPVAGSGAEKTNPIEVAETSAIGRALGFLGYGLIGTGIASAEEIQVALNIQRSEKQLSNNESQPQQNSNQKANPQNQQPRNNQQQTRQNPLTQSPKTNKPNQNPQTSLDPIVTLVAMRPGDSEDKPYWEMIFKYGKSNHQVFAVGEMFEKVNALPNLKEGTPCRIRTKKIKDKKVLTFIELAS